METLEALKTRRSCRNFDPERMVPEEALKNILEAGTYAASGMGRQSAVIVAITNKDMRDRISRMNAAVLGVETDPFYGAPVILAVLYKQGVGTGMEDACLVLGNLMNAARTEGVDSIWIHRCKEEFASDEGKALLAQWGLEGEYVGVGHCALGYAAAELPAPAPRKENYVVWVR